MSLHTIEDSPAVAHRDISGGQFVKSGGVYKLNDFNCAILLAGKSDTKETCPFQRKSNPGSFRSPEEYGYNDGLMTEKVDGKRERIVGSFKCFKNFFY